MSLGFVPIKGHVIDVIGDLLVKVDNYNRHCTHTGELVSTFF